MNRTTNPLIQIISEKRMRKVLAEKRGTGKAIKKKSPKPNLRDLRKEKRTQVVSKRVINADNSFANLSRDTLNGISFINLCKGGKLKEMNLKVFTRNQQGATN